jgi:hypothetical protein
MIILRDNGKVANNMELDIIQVLTVMKDRENGLMAKELNGLIENYYEYY